MDAEGDSSILYGCFLRIHFKKVKGGVDQDWVEGKLRWQERPAKLHQYRWELWSVRGWSELSSVGLKWQGASVCLLQSPQVNCPLQGVYVWAGGPLEGGQP